MSTTPFRDTLMLDNWSIFKALVADFKSLKTQLSNENRRINKPVCAFTAYDLVKKIADPIVRVMNGRNVSDIKALELFKVAIRKVNLLIRTLADYGRDGLVKTLQRLEKTLILLLPKNTLVQLELFEGEQYETTHKKPVTFDCFKDWKREYLIRSWNRLHETLGHNAYRAEQNKVERLRNSCQSLDKGVRVVQKSIRLR